MRFRQKLWNFYFQRMCIYTHYTIPPANHALSTRFSLTSNRIPSNFFPFLLSAGKSSDKRRESPRERIGQLIIDPKCSVLKRDPESRANDYRGAIRGEKGQIFNDGTVVFFSPRSILRELISERRTTTKKLEMKRENQNIRLKHVKSSLS